MFYLNSQALAFVRASDAAECDQKQIDFGEYNGECGWNG